MRRTITYAYVIAAAALLSAACSTDKIPSLPPSDGKVPICWDLRASGGAARETRALVCEDKAEGGPIDPYCVTLSKACTPTDEGGYGFAVGLWGDYSYTKDGEDVTVSNVFNGVRVIYSDNAGNNPESYWNYQAEEQYWYPGGKYKFRAYYPQKLSGYVVSTSNATSFAMVCPTHKMQYDLLLGYADADTKNHPAIMQRPVPVNMHHALAALRFKFRLGFEGDDRLTSVYLLNDDDLSFCIYGTIIYGSEADPESVQWKQDYNPKTTDEMYKWVHKTGVYMKTSRNADQANESYTYENEAMAYTYDPGYIPESGTGSGGGTGSGTGTDTGGATGTEGGTGSGGATESDSEVTEGELYCRNSGWVLIVPQKSSGKVSVCFTTSKGGETVYRIALPSVTETDKSGNIVSTEWEAGKRYTYTLTLGQSDLGIAVDIEPWNRLNHSSEIVF